MTDGDRGTVESDRTTELRLAVRIATPEDAATLGRLVGELGYPATDVQLRESLGKLAGSDRVLVIGAEHPTEGLLGLCTVHLLSTIHADGELAQLSALVVSERARGQGVGRRLVGEAERWARDRGAVRIVVTTALHRGGAHAFYERLGYTHTGRRYARALA